MALLGWCRVRSKGRPYLLHSSTTRRRRRGTGGEAILDEDGDEDDEDDGGKKGRSERSCGGSRAADAVRFLEVRLQHARLVNCGKSWAAAACLVQMYGALGAPDEARRVFAAACARIGGGDVFLCNVMITALARNNRSMEAVELFWDAQTGNDTGGVTPDVYTLTSALAACTAVAATVEGRAIHARAAALALDLDTAVRNALVAMYGKCRCPDLARAVFDSTTHPNPTSWNSLITAYSTNTDTPSALQIYTHMYSQQSSAATELGRITFLNILHACSLNPSFLDNAKIIHTHIAASVLHSDLAINTALITTYGKCGSPNNARAVFDRMPKRNVVTWTAMISAYARNGLGKEALQLFHQMDSEGVKPNRVTFLSALEACSSLKSLELGKATHETIIAAGFSSDSLVATALVSMYGKCSSIQNARVVFNGIQKYSVVSWNAMMTVYSENGQGKEALELFRQMGLQAIKPDGPTFLIALDACTHLLSLENGREIHRCLLSSGLEPDIAVDTALVNMYGKCGSVNEARAVFEKMHRWNVISWTAMIGAYAYNGHYEEALELFQQLDSKDVKPDKVIYLSVLDVCASLPSLAMGRVIHKHIDGRAYECDNALMNALVNMYTKCGSLHDAKLVFDKMHERSLVSWSTMIEAYGQNGFGKEALLLFEQMEYEGMVPDSITFLSILNACSHGGLLQEGREFFASMTVEYGIPLEVEHYVCMIDLLGRAGCLDEAEELVENMVTQSQHVAWTTLLGACQTRGNIDRGVHVAQQVLKLDPNNNFPYYAMLSKMWNDDVDS